MSAQPSLLAAEVLAGSRRALARAITLVESTRGDHREQADELLGRVLDQRHAHAAQAWRVGLSGAPGVGKSTFIEAFGLHALAQGRRVAVLAVDPSSSVSGGSILGDKTRMPELSRSPSAFVRPSPSGLGLGGVARRTREVLSLCEAAGFDLCLVETVGVGQSEVAVADMTDLFLLLLPPAGGDDLQGIKRGIMELTDLAVVNKCDGDLAAAAGRAAADYGNAMRLMRPRTAGWTARVTTCSALHGEGIAAVWDTVVAFFSHVRGSGGLHRRRQYQSVQWFHAELTAALQARLRAMPGAATRLEALEDDVRAGRRLPAQAAARAVDALLRASNIEADEEQA